MFPDHGLLGLRKSEKEVTDLNEMRQEIQRAARDSVLIRNAFMRAEHTGMSGEDKYVLLAYYALKELQVHYQRNMDWLMLTPSPFVIKSPDAPKG